MVEEMVKEKFSSVQKAGKGTRSGIGNLFNFIRRLRDKRSYLSPHNLSRLNLGHKILFLIKSF